MVESLPSIYQALSLTPASKKKKVICIVIYTIIAPSFKISVQWRSRAKMDWGY
jgi:hypothetical protein